MKVSVSILSEYDRLISAVKNVNNSTADFIHIDVMDGKFVDNKKFPLEVTKDIMSITEKKVDMHLMVKSHELIKKYADLQPEYLTFHVEIIKDNKLINYIKSLGIKVGLAINPETKIDEVIPYIDDIDLLLFMSVNPGYGGQNFKEEVLEKIKNIKKVISSSILISIDGGINNETVLLAKKVGCNMVVAGKYITSIDNYDQKIEKLR